MASIKKDNKTGTYYFVLDLPRDPVTGTRKQKKRRGFKTKKEAQQAAAELLHELTRGTYVEETNLSFREFSKMWIKDYAILNKVKENSVRLRTKQIDVLLRYFDRIPIKGITKKMYQDAIMDLKRPSDGSKEYTDTTIRGIHGAARMLFKRALELDLLVQDPTAFARLPRTVETVETLENRTDLPKFMDKVELATFLAAAKEHGLGDDYVTFSTLAYTGMRLGEYLALKETDFNFEENTISITKNYYNPTNKMTDYKITTPKTKHSTRVIECDPIVMNLNRALIADNREFKMLYRQSYHDKGFVLVNKESNPGYPYTHKHIIDRMRRLLKIAGLNQTLGPHSLRHTHTSLLSEAGVPIEEIMDRLGHKNDSTTRDVYLHITRTRKKEASFKFSEIMNGL